jgi:hypothetical protein
MRVLAIMLVTALLAVAGSSISVPHSATPLPTPAVSGGSCAFGNMEIATASSFDQSTSPGFVKLRSAGSITFKQNRTGCVAGTFFANAGNGDGGDHVLLRVLLDGTACAPFTSGYIFANSGTDFTSHAAAFFCGARIVPGKHMVQVQYASGLGGNAEIFQRTLEVSHR